MWIPIFAEMTVVHGTLLQGGILEAPSLCSYWAVNVVAVSELMVTVYSVPGS